MPKYESHWHPKGSIGGLTFFTYWGEHYMKPKSTLKGDRVRSDPAFEGTRRASNEFGIAARYAAVIRKMATLGLRKAIGPSDGNPYDGTFHSRLSETIAAEIRRDIHTPPSLRHLVHRIQEFVHFPGTTKEKYTYFMTAGYHVEGRTIHLALPKPDPMDASINLTHLQVFAFFAPLSMAAAKHIQAFRSPWMPIVGGLKDHQVAFQLPDPPKAHEESVPWMLSIGVRGAENIGDRYPEFLDFRYIEIHDIIDPADTFPKIYQDWQSPKLPALLAKIDPAWTLILSRDGALNTSLYLPRFWEEWEWTRDALGALPHLAQAFRRILLMAWHPDVGDGEISSEELDEIHGQMHHEINNRDGRIDAIFLCPHGKKEECDCRKPRTGLFRKIQEVYPDTDPARTILLTRDTAEFHMAAKLGIHAIYMQEGRNPLPTIRNLLSGAVRNLPEWVDMLRAASVLPPLPAANP